MLTFLFWNLGRKPLATRVARIAAAHDVDFILLAECRMRADDVLAAANAMQTKPYAFPLSLGNKLHVFSRFPAAAITDEFNSLRMTIRRVMVAPRPDFILAVVHYPDRASWDADDQSAFAITLAADVQRVEDKLGHRRTILVGDLNMNPFDPGVVAATGLHAVMTRDVARRESRVVLGQEFPFFYNPMWGQFGDRTPGPPGSFYLRSSKPVNHFWNLYDQVLLRPGMMDRLTDLRILDTDGQDSLLTAAGLPKESDGSDHLPILFRLDV